MRAHQAAHRRGWRALTAAALVAAAMVGSSGATAQAASAPAAAAGYRHGVVPQLGSTSDSRATGSVAASGGGLLKYGGGTNGIGVTTGPPQVYVIFWGAQWGSAGSDGNGYTTLSRDIKGMAPALQAFFAGLGTAGESWSGVMTQYCEGIAAGSTSCPLAATHVGYPAGGALAAVWADNGVRAPSSPSGHQLAAEAVRAARHFGNTAFGSNRNNQYFIVSPHGSHPDGFPGSGFCAWHDYTTDSTLPGGPAGLKFDPLAFTNMPYVTDAGTSCGSGFVNGGGAGALDGVTIVGGHEYAETITDQYPNGGWLDSTPPPNGPYENGDKCAWISSGLGASQNLSLATGTFAVQSTWSNDNNGCRVTHPIM
ncbi:MAG: hypothetical protein M3N98_16585 [Actinomycetota bacterium]|nr:hypothetical protein [Actinomycetota bacterium]